MFSTIGYEETRPNIFLDSNLIQMNEEQTTFSNLLAVSLATNTELIISANTQKANASSDHLPLCVRINTYKPNTNEACRKK